MSELYASLRSRRDVQGLSARGGQVSKEQPIEDSNRSNKVIHGSLRDRKVRPVSTVALNSPRRHTSTKTKRTIEIAPVPPAPSPSPASTSPVPPPPQP